MALRLLADRRDQLGRTRTEVVSRLHHLLLELIPGGAKKFLSAQQPRALLNTVRPRDLVGKTRRWLASELIHELVTIDKKIKLANAELPDLVASTGSTLQEPTGIGPSGAVRLIGDIARFASRAHFASWNGTAPIDASSGDQNRHRLSQAGNRRINRALHIMAVVQLRRDTEGRRYYRRKLADGKTPMEAMRALKRRLSDIEASRPLHPALAVATTLPLSPRTAILIIRRAYPGPRRPTKDYRPCRVLHAHGGRSVR
ncbi:transposase [Actinoplanes sp. NPDC023801]|uniref:transposase n=1 Tax=Actinoplanes sp. NPDC023801 TaxID=3154595 RepID=UPI00340A74C9